MSELRNVVIIGAGQAGGWVARTLRDQGFDGRIALVGEENHPPHERPPLSKAVLTGAAVPESTYLWDADSFAKLELDFRPGIRAVDIDRQVRTVSCDDGRALDYDRLVLATGSRVRTLNLPGAESERVHYLRSLADCAAIRAGLQAGSRLLVIGGGWIGLEVAASARKLGLNVTVVEVFDRLCARALPPDLADHLLRLHRLHGVDVRLGCPVTGFEPSDDGITALLGDGQHLTVDQVVVGIGILPNTELAEAAGLAVDNGIVTDAVGRTSDPHIFACGDVANHDNTWLGRRVRLESWANAQNQAIATARALLGQDADYADVPWFWSDQYDMNLQMLGLPAQWGEPVIRGDRTSGAFTAFYLDDEQLAAVIAVNNALDIKVAKRLMERRLAVDPQQLTDPGVRLQNLLKG